MAVEDNGSVTHWIGDLIVQTFRGQLSPVF
jgi:hypothetical protein